MSAVRFLARAVAGLVALGIGVVILVPLAVVGIPVLVVVAVGGVIGATALLSVGLPAIIAGLLILVAIAAAAILLGGAIALGVLVLKLMLFALLLSWLARKVFGWTRPPPGPSLVGAPGAEPAAPHRGQYENA